MNIPEDVKALVRNTAPTLLTALALPPPFNLIASAVVANILEKYLPIPTVGDEKTSPKKPNASPVPPSSPINTPEKIIAAIQQNVANPQLAIDLRNAEISLKEYEINAGIRFIEIQMDDKKNSRDFQASAKISAQVFNSGMTLVYIALGGLGLVVIGVLSLVLFKIQFNPDQANLVTAAFGLTGTIVGFINGIASNVVGFYWGSSQGSKEKGDELNNLIQNFGSKLTTQVNKISPSVEPDALPPENSNVADKNIFSVSTPLAVPSKLSVVYAELDKLKEDHSYADKSVSWKIVKNGVSIDNNPPQNSGGELVTVPAIWKSYSDLCMKYAKRYNVPIELIVATIAVESAGNPNASRIERKINDESIGLMQTLVTTARRTLGQPDLTREQLFDPEVSINAGTAYIAQAMKTTRYDPPKVAAAYNAGSLYLNDAPENRWKMRCYPINTGHHIDKFVGFFNDCMQLSQQQDWGNDKDTPSFLQLFQERK